MLGNAKLPCVLHDLGLIGYDEAHGLQVQFVQSVLAGKTPDVLLLLEHLPVITVGKSGTLDNVLVSQELLDRHGVSLVFSDRGGNVTYHGPGQLVAYPIVDLRSRDRDAHRYVRDLEEVAIRTLRDFGIESQRDASHPGVWVNGDEIAAIGLSLKKWITMHGIALNVCPNLEHFALINPCGFADRKATSMSRILARAISVEEVKPVIVRHFSDIFNFNMERGKGALAGSHL
jgi:lipoyl(octanoyl) transferase